MIKEIDIEKDRPPVDVAVAQIEHEIDVHKKFGKSLIKIIHGYGSHGIGGEIRVEARKRLEMLKKQKKILDYITGEQFTHIHIDQMEISQRLKDEMLADYSLDSLNRGITIIVIKEK